MPYFFTTAKCNKFMKPAKHTKANCRVKGQSVTNQDKQDLSHKLYSLAPKSLGDPVAVGVQGQTYVSFYVSPCIFACLCMYTSHRGGLNK